jgi:hypothetical protein
VGRVEAGVRPGPVHPTPGETNTMGTTTSGILDRAADHVCSIDLRMKALEIAIRERKVTTDGVKDEAVKKYQLAVGPRVVGKDYCVAFIYWCYEQAVAQLNQCAGAEVYKNPLPKTGSASALYSHALQNDKLVYPPQAGDLYIRLGEVWNKEGKCWEPEWKHVGFITETPDDLENVSTMDGNTYRLEGKKRIYGVLPHTGKDLSGQFFARY